MPENKQIPIYRAVSNFEYLSYNLVGTPLPGCPPSDTNGFCGHPGTGVPTFLIRKVVDKSEFEAATRRRAIDRPYGGDGLPRVFDPRNDKRGEQAPALREGCQKKGCRENDSTKGKFLANAVAG